MAKKEKATTDVLTLSDGRIFKVRELQLFEHQADDRVRYYCEMTVHQISEPRDCFDFRIFLHHDIFEFNELFDSCDSIAMFCKGKVSVYLESNPDRVSWCSKTNEIHCFHGHKLLGEQNGLRRAG